VKSFEAWLLRLTWNPGSYVGSKEDQYVGRLALFALNDQAWPSLNGKGAREAYLEHIPLDLHAAFELARTRWLRERAGVDMRVWAEGKQRRAQAAKELSKAGFLKA
jgi:hypothetical protein